MTEINVNTINYLKKQAAAGAKKICTAGCMASNEVCGKEHNKNPMSISYNWPAINKDFKCPLEAYNVEREANPKPWWEMHVSELEPSQDELFALCSVCEHAELEIAPATDDLVARKKNLDTACIDCPVHSCWEAMSERDTEASCC